MSTPTFAPARPRRAFDEITAQVRDRVRAGVLTPGDRLPSERVLAEQFAVSRNTVREAMRMLEISGVVELRRGATGGAFIAAADTSHVASILSDLIELNRMPLHDLAEAHLWIESTVVRVACDRIDAATLNRLDQLVDEATRHRASGDWRRAATIDLEFHTVLANATANPVLVAMVGGITKSLRDVAPHIGPADDPGGHHRRLIAHIRAGAQDAAVRELERHLTVSHTKVPAAG